MEAHPAPRPSGPYPSFGTTDRTELSPPVTWAPTPVAVAVLLMRALLPGCAIVSRAHVTVYVVRGGDVTGSPAGGSAVV